MTDSNLEFRLQSANLSGMLRSGSLYRVPCVINGRCLAAADSSWSVSPFHNGKRDFDIYVDWR